MDKKDIQATIVALVDRLDRIWAQAASGGDPEIAAEKMYRCAHDIVSFLEEAGYARDAEEVKAVMLHLKVSYGEPIIVGVHEDFKFYRNRLVVLADAITEPTHRAPTVKHTPAPEHAKTKSMGSQINIHNFMGILGDVQDSTVNQQLDMSIKKGDFASLEHFLRAIDVPHDDINDLQKAINSQPPPRSKDNFGANVSAWIGMMMTKAASGIWKVATTAAATLLAKAISAYYGLQ